MGIFDKLKSIVDTVRKADKIEQYQKILDCQEKLSEKEEKLREKQKDIDDLKTKIQELENENKELKNEKSNESRDLQQKQFEETARNQWKNSCK